MYVYNNAKIKQIFAPEMLAHIRAEYMLENKTTFELVTSAVQDNFYTSVSLNLATDYFKLQTAINTSLTKRDCVLVVETKPFAQTVFVVCSEV